ncbi:MAG: methionyl-tRNA formyltransferase [Pelagibacterales bacterium]|nr:methionyl-tRNA formyltransferase [Pelagibacterales bacterium]OUU63246.1 MAG: methionyl-tRNA formyltransferase [Alphaproteobacteria bacterium TMED62]|tara:strand:- start:805 stop:1752 length:948 start_codon:yes stop_codon:yes gene_type:complete
MNKVLSLAYFAGGSKFTLEPFKVLKDSKHKLQIVYTKEPKRAGRGKKKNQNILFKEVIKNNIRIKTLNDFTNIGNIKALKDLNLDFIIVFSFGLILPKEILKIPKYGCINIHTSLLPKWRGASPVQHTLLNNEKETGYTLIIMNEELDEGNIIYKQRMEIDDKYNYGTLLDKLVNLASINLVKNIESFANNIIKPEAQNHSEASYCYRIKKEDTYINFNCSASEVLGKIRAFSPTPGAKCYLKGELIKILDAKIDGEKKENKKFGYVTDKNLLISCKYGFIRFIKVQRAGRKAMYAKELLNGWDVEEGSIVNEEK